jgi:hypothetical protein
MRRNIIPGNALMLAAMALEYLAMNEKKPELRRYGLRHHRQIMKWFRDCGVV